MLGILILFLVGANVTADVYMHNPRGSNDRNCERNVNRDNGDRLFNSQNNNAGGYACPRAVGDETIMNEDGNFSWVDSNGNTQTQVKKMYYYEGSILPIEFTNQHGCGGNSKLNCEIILQYACEDTLDPQVDNFFPWTAGKNGVTSKGAQHYRYNAHIAAPRDGIPTSSNDAATDTIGDDDQSATPNTPTTRRYAMHENEDYYQVCQHTERNRGLYTADQNVNRNDQRGTRQNPNGNRNGLECPEERDYYPWWQPSPWIDIAVLTDSASDTPCYQNSRNCTIRCNYYFNNTMNFNKKGYCDVSHNGSQSVNAKLNSQAWQNRKWYNNMHACHSAGFSWYTVSHSDNLVFGNNSFVCAKTQYSRVNQLGNARNDLIVSGNEAARLVTNEVHSAATKSVNANRFLWTIPSIPKPKSASYFSSGMAFAYKACVLRIRYNVSTSDFQAWPPEAVNPGTAPMVTSRNNSNSATDINTPITQNPYVYIGPGRTSNTGSEFVKLKINTNQFGRTFQDRSYTFTIKPMPTAKVAATTPRVEQNNVLDTPLVDNALVYSLVNSGGKIYNLNARGKRGNIVQVYPSVEYDFVPDQLALGVGDMVHFQWTGSDYNPRRGCNDGTGGPPDPNTYNTNANTDQNSRADRHNWMLTGFMGKYTPSNYLGYPVGASLPYNTELQDQFAQIVQMSPCNNITSAVEQSDCYNQMIRLAYLNQQEDGMSLYLRQNNLCLTVSQLNAISNTDQADNHPLNCAKLNAKPTPYFDGGVMAMFKNGWFSYFDSRNNNFSNRMNIGIICVGPTCTAQPGTNVLQDQNPLTNGAKIVNHVASNCQSTSTAPGQAVNGVQSCIGSGQMLTGPTFAGNEGDNDNKGDGTSTAGCAQLTYAASVVNTSTVEGQVIIAVACLVVALVLSYCAFFMYNRYKARQAGVSKYRNDVAWMKQDNQNDLAASDPTANSPTERNAMI